MDATFYPTIAAHLFFIVLALALLLWATYVRYHLYRAKYRDQVADGAKLKDVIVAKNRQIASLKVRQGDVLASFNENQTLHFENRMLTENLNAAKSKINTLTEEIAIHKSTIQDQETLILQKDEEIEYNEDYIRNAEQVLKTQQVYINSVEGIMKAQKENDTEYLRGVLLDKLADNKNLCMLKSLAENANQMLNKELAEAYAENAELKAQINSQNAGLASCESEEAMLNSSPTIDNNMDAAVGC